MLLVKECMNSSMTTTASPTTTDDISSSPISLNDSLAGEYTTGSADSRNEIGMCMWLCYILYITHHITNYHIYTQILRQD